MTQPRTTLVSLDDTPWYHCVSRCVRRAFLCGEDALTGRNFEHRRGWIADRIRQLAAIFAIDVAAYAVMSNHYHIVIRVDRDRALAWSVEEVLRRWTRLFAGPLLVQRYLSEERVKMTPAEIAQVHEFAEIYRARLYDLSWFMRTLNEHIARKANAEDGVKGRFWEGRFKSQALLDEAALLAAMAYVDLNPVRAGIADTPEDSDFTSIQARLRDTVSPPLPTEPGAITAPLMPFDATGRTPWAIPFDFQDYVALVDWTGRAVRNDKRGHIGEHQPKILARLGIDGRQFLRYADRLLKDFGSAVGQPPALVELCARRQRRYLRGIRRARQVFRQAA